MVQGASRITVYMGSLRDIPLEALATCHIYSRWHRSVSGPPVCIELATWGKIYEIPANSG